MAEPQQSAEKDLLKIIENPKDIDSQKKPAVSESSAAAAAPLSAGAKSKKSASSVNVRSLLLDRRNIIRGLVAITVGAFIFFIVSTIQEYSKLKKARNFDSFTYIVNGQEQKATVNSGPLTSMAANEEESGRGLRNIFRPGAKAPDEQKKESVPSPSQDLKLVGIAVEKNPDDSYAMVENERTKITFFLKKGESIEGMKVTEITEDRIVLDAQGQKIELR